jgi:hypothetical protein
MIQVTTHEAVPGKKALTIELHVLSSGLWKKG